MKFNLPNLDVNSTPGHYYQLLISRLSPTQNAVGMDEVDIKTKKIAGKKEESLKEYLYLRPIPVIIGLDSFFLIDRHHMSRSLWEAAGKKNKAGLTRKNARAVIKVVENWQFITSPKRFWKTMDDNNWVYPYDASGGGPLNVGKLKKHIKDLDNDPYRSLAWYVRKRFGFFKDPANPIFAEFKWADFFRTRVRLSEALFDPESGETIEDVLLEKYDEAVRDEIISFAVALARSSQASSLPGYFIA